MSNANLPARYRWLLELPDLPNTIGLALQELGVKEIIGKGSNKTIISWRDELNLAGVRIAGFSDDDTPWCGLFAAIVTYRRMGVSTEPVESPLWARNWASYGYKADKPSLGDVLVFKRGNGGHVAFYIGEDDDCYHIIGGNQGNCVSITRITKSRLLAARRPPYKIQPSSVKVYKLSAEGTISKNEA